MNVTTVTKRCTAVLAASVFAMALGAAPGAQAAGPKKGGTLVAVWQLEPHTLYSARGGGSSPLIVNTKILEKLVRQVAIDKFEPELASSWDISSDYKTYTFKLRKTNWHDGKPFTSADVQFTLKDVLAKLSSNGLLRAIEKVETPDAQTAIVHFSRPAPEYLALASLAASQSSIIPKHIYAGTKYSKNPANNAPIGTGPFKLKEWARGSHVEMVRNEGYWQKGRPHLDRLVIRYIRDPGARAAAMEGGEVLLAVSNPFPGPEIDRLAARPDLVADKKGYDTSKWQMLMEMNVRNPILAKKQVRQAIAYAIDQNFIVDTIFYGLGNASTGPIPVSQTRFYSPDTASYPYDPKKAGELLDKAGYPVKADGKRFTLKLVASPWFTENKKTGQYLKQVLEDIKIGINMETPDRGGTIRQIYCNYDFDITVSNSIASADPLIGTTHWFTSNGIRKCAAFRNASDYSNPALDKVVDQAAVETDPAKRKALLAEFQKIAMENVPIMHLVDIGMTNVVNTKVHNYSFTSQWMYDSWKDVWLEK
ncbi:MAG: ABC transporter substrate-binding protein [Rhodospirillales bacterium]|jgi:peptide/nickel transport system substrate-binding protein|nr:ABC transporter substrate-binding protein [Rhodospirillales bacterium]MDP6772700.1 ABC transporter substrate-binding protein [Rhodospirillales bacterium]